MGTASHRLTTSVQLTNKIFQDIRHDRNIHMHSAQPARGDRPQLHILRIQGSHGDPPGTDQIPQPPQDRPQQPGLARGPWYKYPSAT
jgi:hypothetical protein